tara:strand:+ start:190 stop:390 length:201 start_codon:yes stop_codon:yes gene_type:complete
MISKIGKYFSSVGLEMKKVSWLSKSEMVSSTIVVAVFSVIVTIFLFIIDTGLIGLLRSLFGLGGGS